MYPASFELNFLLKTPEDDMKYVLFAVAVHQGQHYNSGHYYSFVNTSTDSTDPFWVKFDDRRVHLASEAQALNFAGGKRKHIVWSK